jgi:adenine-specific DNA methylase
MNINKEAFDAVLLMLDKERNVIEHELWNNKRQFKQLAERQTLLKRKRTEITKLIRLAVGRR